MLMCCLVGAFSRPKTDLVRRRYTYLHIQHTQMHKNGGSHTADTYMAASLCIGGGAIGSCRR